MTAASPRPAPPARRPAGLMLIEVLVALAIFSLMSVVAYAALGGVLDTRQRVNARMERLATLQTAFWRIERDLDQAAPRGIRDEHGDRRPAVVGGTGDPDRLLELTRAGWSNPAGLPRSDLQRVAYALHGRELRRLSWAVLDRAGDSRPIDRLLVDGVDRAELHFLDGSRQWRDYWPIEAPAGSPENRLLAIELVVEVEGFGRLRRIFVMPPDAIR